MKPDQRILVVGIYINSALYLIGVFVASAFINHGTAWKLVVLSAGLSFLSYTGQVCFTEKSDRYITASVTAMSVAAGLAGGIAVVLGG